MINALSLVDALLMLGRFARVVAMTIAEGETIESFIIRFKICKETRINFSKLIGSPVYGNTALAKNLQASAVPSARFILPGCLIT